MFGLNLDINGVYWFLFILGLGFAVVSAIMSGMGEASGGGTDLHVDTGGGMDGIDAGGDTGGLGHTDIYSAHGEIGVNPISPITIFSFLGGFGGGGLMALSAGMKPALSLIVALPTGFLLAFAIYFLMHKLNQANVTSVPESSEIIGVTGEITTPIIEEGTGEIAYIARGSRYSSPARSIDGRSILRGRAVKIWRIVGSTCYVKEINPEEAEDPDINLSNVTK